MRREGELNLRSKKIDITEKVSGSQQRGAVSSVGLNRVMTDLTVGDSEMLRATILPANTTDQRLTWASSNEAVATVDENGEVTAVAAGTANITVTTVDGGKTATCKVTVREQGSIVESIRITAASPLPQVRRGRTMQLSATVTPEGAADVTWTSSNPAVLTVDATGKVTGVKAGLVMVTATANGKSASILIRVTA